MTGASSLFRADSSDPAERLACSNVMSRLTSTFRLTLGACQASPAPPVGSALGQRGLNLMNFCKEFNDRTAAYAPGTPMQARPPAPPAKCRVESPPITFTPSARGASRRLRSGPPSPRAPPQVEVRSYADRTFDFDVSTPLSSYFLKKAAGVEKGTSKPGIEWVGSISVKEIYEIAKVPPPIPPALRPQSARGVDATLMVRAAAGQDDRPQAAGAFQPEDDVQVARSPVQVHRPEGILSERAGWR